MKTFYVSKDLQGDEFGMYRHLTIEQWRQQAIDWATSDDNQGFVKVMKKCSRSKVLDNISIIWCLEFKESPKSILVKNRNDLVFYYKINLENNTFEIYDTGKNYYNDLTIESEDLETNFKYVKDLLKNTTIRELLEFFTPHSEITKLNKTKDEWFDNFYTARFEDKENVYLIDKE